MQVSGKKELSSSQHLAIEHITQYARIRKHEAQKSIKEVLQMSNISWNTFEDAVAKLLSHARVALHFHPDRPMADMKSVAQSLLEQGIYKSQFETHISNGSVSAYPGGARDLWEKKMFGGAYQLDGVTNNQRPKYGALHVMLHPDGPAPRFGSCYFLLSPKVSYRCTYTYLDSYQDPKEKGSYAEFDDILAAIFKDAFFQDYAIGEKDLTPRKLIDHLLYNLEWPFKDSSKREPSRNLNHYIEAQVHGDIALKDDVEVLVADPSFKGTYIGGFLEKMCVKYSIDLYWHMGFSMRVEEIPEDFRGPTMPSLAERIARNNYIDASVIGVAANDLKRNPELWSDRGGYEKVLQELKYMWHVLVRFGNSFARE
ncbi:DUF3626 domain-containing protein [Brevibacillus laterosporus]|uniref:DUF3626 domain-containing protein n=1 Tax=Brevibacillus laterosporus TaxID=1465 RepID=UPI000E6BD715|nr:DUF3626 domain-containing protein [Brevibacillus laterosporus]AYB39645.1 DUF3626 domain-containing protein [Brevibacillus laterosporus]MBM7109058.1 hypothetical protein [Brevibacillus laterosporus]